MHTHQTYNQQVHRLDGNGRHDNSIALHKKTIIYVLTIETGTSSCQNRRREQQGDRDVYLATRPESGRYLHGRKDSIRWIDCLDAGNAGEDERQEDSFLIQSGDELIEVCESEIKTIHKAHTWPSWSLLFGGSSLLVHLLTIDEPFN